MPSPTSPRPDTDNYLDLFLNDVPLMDVRAPVEFNEGAFPQAHNIPLLDDRQREEIGIRYKEAGQDAAIRLGNELATPAIRHERLAAWSDFCRRHPDGYLYCFRGGLRSRTTQQWLREAGIGYPLVRGGYKAMRRFLLQQFEALTKSLALQLLAGRTGSGKTRVLHRLPHYVDLEGLARHRGSAFGGGLAPQPAQIDWENAVAIGLLKHRHRVPGGVPLVLEDEGRLVGRIWVPNFLQARMKQADLILLERDMEGRVELILEDYIVHQWPTYRQHYGDAALREFSDYVLGNLARIRKRLGGERHAQLDALFRDALTLLDRRGDASGFAEGIRRLLLEYYDPMYDHLLSKREGRILFRGSEAEVVEWVQAQRAERLAREAAS